MVSFVLAVMWVIGAYVYCFNIPNSGGKIIVIAATALLLFSLYQTYNILNINTSIESLYDLLDLNRFESTYLNGIRTINTSINPSFKISVSIVDDLTTIEFLSPVNINNFMFALHIEGDGRKCILDAFCWVHNRKIVSLNPMRISLEARNEKLNKLLYEELDSSTFTVFYRPDKSGNESWIAYSCDILPDSNSSAKIIIIKDVKPNSKMPASLIEQFSSLKTNTIEIWYEKG